MTKQDILNMIDKYDIMQTLKANPELWDDEINEHLKTVARKYLLDTFGDESVLFDPFPRKHKNVP